MVSTWGRGVLGLQGWVQDAAGESCSPPGWSQPPWASCSPALSPSELISIRRANGEHKTYLKATFTTWLIPLGRVITRCHISSPNADFNAFPTCRAQPCEGVLLLPCSMQPGGEGTPGVAVGHSGTEGA